MAETALPRRRLTSWRKGVALLMILALGLLSAVAICEIAVRLFVPPLIMPRWVENAPYGIRKQVGNVRGFIVTPEYRNKMTTNSRGFRGTNEYAIPKPAGVYRVVALGDSVVCGYGVEDDQTFCDQLQKKLSPQRPTEVLNLGIPGFSNAEELIQLENVGFEYQPDLVVLGYFVNDHFENLTSDLYRLDNGKLNRNTNVIDKAIYIRDRLSRIPGYTFFCQHSYLVNFLRLRASSFFREKASAKHDLGAAAYTSDKPTDEQVKLTATLVDEIIRVCAERGIKVVVLDIPMEINGKWMHNMPTDRLTRKNQARIVDVATEIWGREDIWNIALHGSYHPKARGHELIAEWLANYIKSELWTNATASKAAASK